MTVFLFLCSSWIFFWHTAYAGTLSCLVQTSACSGDEIEIFEMENNANAHAGLPAASYNNFVCCTGVPGLGNYCSGTFATVLKLSGTTSAHVRQGTLTDYPSVTNACISVPNGGTVTVGYQAIDCSGFDTTLGSITGTANSHVGDGNWTNGPTKICATATGAGILSVDIVDPNGVPVTSPSIAMETAHFSFAYQTASGTLGTSAQRIKVSNTTINPQWTLTIAADSGSGALWSAGAPQYDFNDSTAGAVDGADADSYGGQLTVSALDATFGLGGTCSGVDIIKGSPVLYSEGVTDSITLLTTGVTANCFLYLIGVNLSQTIPAEQAVGGYSINMILTVTAT